MSKVCAYIVRRDKLGGDLCDLVTLCAGGQGDITCVQGHVAALYAFGGQCAQCTHVLGQAYGDDNFAQCLRSEEHTSELQSLMRISYAVFCLKKKKHNNNTHTNK